MITRGMCAAPFVVIFPHYSKWGYHHNRQCGDIPTKYESGSLFSAESLHGQIGGKPDLINKDIVNRDGFVRGLIS
jgi:hypothetical protein